MNPHLAQLQPYPFARLAQLLAEVTPPAQLKPINLSIGEPKHAAPPFIGAELTTHLHALASYPTTRGALPLRAAGVRWLEQRYKLDAGALDVDTQVLPVNGTREALFAFAQCVIDPAASAYVVMPNPFYQIYEGAAWLAGAEPYFLSATAESAFLPDFNAVPEAIWQRCRLLYVCSPANPTGAVHDQATLQALIRLAQKHDFIIAADECYAEIYDDETQPPVGLLQAAWAMGHTDFKRCMVFHSLSKRSNVPGLRSGLVAGDAALIKDFLLYRTYHGSAMSPPVQAASARAWSDEEHVRENRALYREKFSAVLAILQPVLQVSRPAAGFYLWARIPLSDTEFARRLYAEQHVTVLPGSFLARSVGGNNPGAFYIRIALVAPLEECVEAAQRLKNFLATL